ncbi:c-type cytochrome [Lentisphaera marina]|uniref:c-type cytochrome n=1 Tax=Lentisphaera marina TaxID=1111041 RepID=UPI002365AB8D|nr:c-type cytochrome [Lentisphaera marina]MDD7987190.1 c-type cytochrome [Lentisphaera marina]
MSNFPKFAFVLFFCPFLWAQEKQSHLQAAELFRNKCIQCHGEKAEGKKSLKTPALASQSKVYLLEQLKKFKAGVRGKDAKTDAVGHLMGQQVKNLSSEQIDALASYLSSLKAPISPQIKNESFKRGEQLYQKHANCISCHGLYAEGNESMKAPKLNILSAQYIESALKKFSNGQRVADGSKDPHGQLMVKVLKDYSLQAQDFKDLAAYISGLKQVKD